jgi:hypothetical protein
MPSFVGAQTSTIDRSQRLDVDANSRSGSPGGWKGAFKDSLRLLTLEHATRITFQEKTRRELGGPFFEDYFRSLKMPDTWNDGDRWPVNYVGHPIHGAAAGFIWLDNEDGSHNPKLGFSRDYWAGLGRATAWAAAYSLQFEFGPLSEASIGNVGLHPGTTGWVDHVVTPAGALAFMVAEDALDRYLITRIESATRSRALRVIARVALNPSRTLANFSEGRALYYRATRSLNGEGRTLAVAAPARAVPDLAGDRVEPHDESLDRKAGLGVAHGSDE